MEPLAGLEDDFVHIPPCACGWSGLKGKGTNEKTIYKTSEAEGMRGAQIGRATYRERVEVSGVAVTLKIRDEIP